MLLFCVRIPDLCLAAAASDSEPTKPQRQKQNQQQLQTDHNKKNTDYKHTFVKSKLLAASPRIQGSFFSFLQGRLLLQPVKAGLLRAAETLRGLQALELKGC